MPDPTLPLPTDPHQPHGRQPAGTEPAMPPVDPYASAPLSAAGYPPPVEYALPAGQPPALPIPATLPMTPPTPPAPIVARVGEISVSSTTVYTPTGEMPLRGSQWVLSDQWQANSKIPTWAIVLTILTFFCIPIFNFLFLLAKETYYTGVVAVSVTSAGRHYVARIPVGNQVHVANLQSQVNYVRSLAAL